MEDKLVWLLCIIALGYLFGQARFLGLTFGSSGVIFVALVMGHFGAQIPEGIGTLGLVLFVYCLGISAGPGFLGVLGTHGRKLVVMVVGMVLTSILATWGVAKVLALPVDLTCGLFSGALTSTPALAATTEVLPPGSQAPVGFGIAYPFGVIGVVLFVQLLPRFMGKTFAQMEEEAGAGESRTPVIQRTLVEVENPAVIGRRLSDMEAIERSNCQITRVLVGNQLRPVPSDFTLQLGQTLLAVGNLQDTRFVCELLGKHSLRSDVILDTEQQRRKVVVSSPEIVGKSLRELKLLSTFGVTIARITRHDYEFVPRSAEAVQFADALTAVGEPEALQRFAAFAGHREKAFEETNIISLTFGILLGVILGKVVFQVGKYSLELGVAAGPLLSGLVLGHFGRVGPFVGHLPQASRMLMTELGLAFFLADAGVKAGAGLGPVMREHGLTLLAGGAVITTLPILAGFALGRWLLGLNLLQILGAICGGRTSTPGLGVINGQTDSDIPIASYAASYPVALILVTIFGRLLVSILGGS